ncbi:bifunctional folylpolyglutamate synthase/dihydrofolate synthase [Gammaproteobacteria bacterium]|nr:bifunctional folylpolyglutamate synthase/dihydrofolate synthase [Gammaproteobacteria bacterium]
MDLVQRLNQHHPKIIDLSLDRIFRLLDLLDNPQTSLPPLIHVAGTNGKGSTIAFARSIAEAAGLTVHVYTSPHLVEFNERIRICGKIIKDQDLIELISEVEDRNGNAPITFFEITTAIAFLAFSRIPSDLVLLETGLGGRLDATNVITRPTVTVLTPISHDHANFLGDNLTVIAKEKAGIMKSGVACITAKQDPLVLEVIKNHAENIAVPLSIENKDWWVAIKGNKLSIMTPDGQINSPLPNLVGPHQIQNAALGIMALAELSDKRINRQAVATGIRNVEWPARMQQITQGPLCTFLPSHWELWLDGGHNPAAGVAIALTLESLKDLPVHLITGLINTKTPLEFLMPLRKHTKSLTAITIPNVDASFSSDEISTVANEIGFKTKTASSVSKAIKNIVSAEKSPARILICGSLYLAGDILKKNK